MKIKLAQLKLSSDIETNKNQILKSISSSKKDEWIIFPEGMLSGYSPEKNNFVKSINRQQLTKSLKEIANLTKRRQCNCILGSVAFQKNSIYNASIFIDLNGQTHHYYKNNLSTLDRNIFSMGHNLDIFKSDKCIFGIQMCREVRYPEQWRILKQQGAQIIFHINNAVNEYDAIWENILISRAYENQIFICSVNATSSNSKLSSLLISPSGKIIFKSNPTKNTIKHIEIDLKKISNIFIEQTRNDLLEVILKNP